MKKNVLKWKLIDPKSNSEWFGSGEWWMVNGSTILVSMLGEARLQQIIIFYNHKIKIYNI